MINIDELVKRHQLGSLQDRIQETEDTLDLAVGLWQPRDDELLPAPTNTIRRRAWDRAQRQMQSLGPRVTETKTNAILGDVTWGGTDEDLDDRLRDLNLRKWAHKLLVPYLSAGIVGGYVYDSDTGPRITRLGGYLEPYTDPDDADTILGLYQAWQVVREHRTATGTNAFGDDASTTRHVGKWIVRVYDWSESPDGMCVMRQWTDVSVPYFLAGRPDEELEMPRPRYAIRTMSQDGLPVGELLAAMPQFRALWATEARMALSEELAAFPMLKALGDVDDDLTVGAAEIITGGDTATVEWMEPGNLEQLRLQRALRIERLTADLSLPLSFSTTQAVSAESARERNIQFRQNTAGYARDMSQLLSELVGEDYALAIGAQPVPVVVLPSMEYDEASRTQSVSSLYRDGLIPLRVAASAVQPFFPTWDDDAFEAWVSSQEATVSVTDFLNPEAGEP